MSKESRLDQFLMNMNIIAHRGFWIDPVEKNTLKAFTRALKNGFGVETDFRDYQGQLVISHDIPKASSVLAQQFVDLYKEYPVLAPIAINIKADGLHDLIKKVIEDSCMKNYFVFDMAIPDMFGYFSLNIEVFTRISEYEINPVLINQCSGVWLDSLGSNWYGLDNIRWLLEMNKKVAIVSPELHQRPHYEVWSMLKDNEFHKNSLLSLCTDYPKEAMEYFNVKN